MRRLLGSSLAIVFLVPLVLAESPSLAGGPTTPRVQAFVDGLLSIPEVEAAFQDGDVVVVTVGSESWHGTVAGRELVLSAGGASGAIHTLRVDPAAMLSIVNSYDMGNTAKLAVKKRYMTAESERAAVKTAIGALARTPLDDRLPTYDPKTGDRITFGGCTGTLGAKSDGRFTVQLCEDNYTVNEIGGITSKLARAHLAADPPGDERGPDDAAGESFGPDEDAYEKCVAKLGPHPKRSDTTSKKTHKAVAKKWHKALRNCLGGA